jgi:hypothetical protein
MTIKSIFPAKENVLTEGYRHFENFFPIATVEMQEDGHALPIHIIYTFLQGSNADEQYFLDGEYGGSFSFGLIAGYCEPTFKKEALKIDEDYQEFLNEAKDKYQFANKRYGSAPLEFPNKPAWWQGDDTPVDEKGNPLKFVCQADLAGIVDDDCRLFVFYDPMNKRIKTVYQRD